MFHLTFPFASHRYDYQNSNCHSREGSAAILSVVGCTAKIGWNRDHCGATVERTGPDYLDTYISRSSKEWPRVLSAGGVVNGRATQRIECADEDDCVRTDDHNAPPAPSTQH
mgnify:CR=1 FL=1